MSVEIVELANTDAFDMEPIRDLFVRAFTGEAMPDSDGVTKFLRGGGLSDGFTVILAHDLEAGWTGLAILQNTPWVFADRAWIIHFYSQNANARRALLAWTRRWMEREGVGTIRILNATGRSDKAHMRLFREFADPTLVGGVIDYTVRAQA